MTTQGMMHDVADCQTALENCVKVFVPLPLFPNFALLYLDRPTKFSNPQSLKDLWTPVVDCP